MYLSVAARNLRVTKRGMGWSKQVEGDMNSKGEVCIVNELLSSSVSVRWSSADGSHSRGNERRWLLLVLSYLVYLVGLVIDLIGELVSGERP